MITMDTKMVFVTLALLFTVEVAFACRTNSACASGWCEGGGVWSSGHCIAKRHDGQHCYRGDPNSCHSRQCTCGLCGRKQNGGATCATNDNCHSNWCEKGSGLSSLGCTGRCIAKRADGQPCHNGDGNSCHAGQCTCGSCGRKLPAGRTCATNDNCQSNWCQRPSGRWGCSGSCQAKRYDGHACHNADGNSCHSGQCTCGSCGRKLPAGKTCATNDNCISNWCERPHGRVGCSGTCRAKRVDGVACHNSDGKSCTSGQCTCGTCGRQLANYKKCATNDNCLSRWCHPAATIGCGGSCRRKAYDYESCVDGNHCTSGRCEGVGIGSKYCAPKNGFKLGFKCNEDTDCDVTKSYWCKGGSAVTTGSCTACPSECKDGCNALFDQGLSCGRKNTWDHMGDIIMCVAGVDDLKGCAMEFAKIIPQCIDGNCDVTIGGPGKHCLKMGKEMTYTKSWGSSPVLTVSGSMKAEGGLMLGLGLTIPSRFDMSMKLHGTIGLHAKAELKFTSSRTKKITRRMELARPKILFRKVVQAGYLPIMIILKVQPVAYAELTSSVSAAGSLSFSYDNPRALTLRDIGINVANFKPAAIPPKLTIDLNKDVVPNIKINGRVSVTGFLRIGPEIVLEVNGMPFKFFPSVHVKLGTSLQYDYINGGHCLHGQVVAGIGIDAGIKGPISGFNPGSAASSACLTALSAACKAIDMNIKAKAAMCIAKQITKKDICDKEGPTECANLGKAIQGVEPKNPFKGLDEISKEIMKPKEAVKSIKIGSCANVGNVVPNAVAGSCKRPAGGCRVHWDRYRSVDCDGDGIMDHVCTTTVNTARWLVLSSEGCPAHWGTHLRPVSKCVKAFGGPTVQQTITALITTSPALKVMCKGPTFPQSYGVGKMHLGGVADSRMNPAEIITWENTVGRPEGCQWLGWADTRFANKKLRISFWIKFVGSVPPRGGNFGMKVYGRVYNDWVSKCTANQWCYVELVKQCAGAGDGYHIILIFDSIARKQVIRVTQLQIQILKPGAGKDAPLDYEDEVMAKLMAEEEMGMMGKKDEDKEVMDEQMEDEQTDDDITFEDYYKATLYENERIVPSKDAVKEKPE